MVVCKKYQTPERALFTNSWVGGPLVSRTYLLYRWLLVIVFLAFLLHSYWVKGSSETGGWWKYWVYFTNWSRTLALVTFSLDAALVTKRWRRELDGQVEVSTRLPSQQMYLPLSHQLLWALWNMNSCVSVLVSGIYWVGVYPTQEKSLEFDDLSGHALLCMVNIADVFISARPWRCLHGYHSLLFCGVYALFNLAYIKTGGTNYDGNSYIYHQLDWNAPIEWSTMSWVYTIMAVLLVIPFIHIAFILLYKVRSGVEQRCGHDRVTARDDSLEMAEGSLTLLDANNL